MTSKKFKDFIPDRQSLVSRRLEQHVVKEATYDTDITDATTVFIGSELSDADRRSLSNSFINKFKEICESGCSVMAIAVAME